MNIVNVVRYDDCQETVNSEPNINIDFGVSVRTENSQFIFYCLTFCFLVSSFIFFYHHHHHLSFLVGLAPVLMVHNGRKKRNHIIQFITDCFVFVLFHFSHLSRVLWKLFASLELILEFEWHSQCRMYSSYYALCPLIPYNYLQWHEYRVLSHARQFIILKTECRINKSWIYIRGNISLLAKSNYIIVYILWYQCKRQADNLFCPFW